MVFECGPISDDTQLTLATCEAIVAAQGAVKPALIADRFVALPKEAAALDAHAEIVRIGDALGRVLNR